MRRILWLLPICLLALGCPDEPKTVGLKRGQIAPPLEGKDLDGKTIKLSDHRGKVVLVDFWATWCEPCKKAIPHEKEMVKRLEGRPFAFIGVCISPAAEDLRNFLKKTPLPWPNIYDGQPGRLAEDWRVDGFPTMAVIDAEGIIRYRDYGGPGVEATIDMLLAEMEHKSN